MASFHFHTTSSTGRGIAQAFSASLASANQALGIVRRRTALPLGTVMLSGTFLLGGMVAGALISTQWQVHSASSAIAASPPVTRQSDRDIVSTTISKLESEQIRLK